MSTKDPRLSTVQFNMRIPWYMREALALESHRRHVSATKLLIDAACAQHPSLAKAREVNEPKPRYDPWTDDPADAK